VRKPGRPANSAVTKIKLIINLKTPKALAQTRLSCSRLQTRRAYAECQRNTLPGMRDRASEGILSWGNLVAEG